ncbi:unnamed protein product, partial [Brassica oleracea var. botrytis]
ESYTNTNNLSRKQGSKTEFPEFEKRKPSVKILTRMLIPDAEI